MSRLALSIVVPVFNEEKGVSATLAGLLERLQAVDADWELIVVNDGSTDGSAAILRDFSGIRAIHHESNLGYGAALKTGIRHARHPWILITDADGTYPLDRLSQLLALTEEADMVVGARTGDKVVYPFMRRVAKWFLVGFAQWVARRKIPDLNSGLRIFRKSVAERFLNILSDRFSFTTTLTIAMMKNGYVVRYVPIDYLPRHGHSKIRPVRDTLNFVQLLFRLGVYFAPLRIFLPLATLFFLLFAVSLARDMVHWDLTEGTWLCLFLASQLAMFGILTDMINKRLG